MRAVLELQSARDLKGVRVMIDKLILRQAKLSQQIKCENHSARQNVNSSVSEWAHRATKSAVLAARK